MKKLKLKSILLEVEVDDKIEDGTYIDLDEDIIVSSGTFKNLDINGVIFHKTQEKNYYGKPINEFLYDTITPEEFENAQPIKRKVITDKSLVGRKATPFEENLIKEHFNKPILKLNSEPETNFDLIVYDISPTNKLVFNNVCLFAEFDNGEKEVFFSVDKYNIRHNIVYDINQTETNIEYDEDISTITDLIK
jgi:hypothetical protein